MSLKAGRVGVNPADVDPINGHINPSSMEGYTKQEADAKFQPMTLEVPIKYINGSVLGIFNTVEEALSGSYGPDGAMTNKDLTEKKFDRSEQRMLGAKNALRNNVSSTGIFTVNADGTVTANGTPAEQANISLGVQSGFSGKYKQTGGVSQNIFITAKKNGNWTNLYSRSKNGYFEIDLIPTDRYEVYLVVQANTQANNDVFYPMLRLASDPDDTYAPYAMTNRELTVNKLDVSVIKSITAEASDFSAFKTAIANL